jgi:hypothetical protein
MGKKIDLAVKTYVTYKRARWVEDFTIYRSQREADRDHLRASRAADAHFYSVPTTHRGALCHLLYAWRQRRLDECIAADGHEEYREIAAGRPVVVFADGTVMRRDIVAAAKYAGFTDAAKAAPLLRKAARMVTRRQPGALVLLRQALAIVKAHPLPDMADNEAVERHTELALTFLATPRTV